MHQRSCRVIQGLQTETLKRLEDELVQTFENEHESELDIFELDQNDSENCFVKQGVQLPRSPQQLLNANEFVKAAFSNTSITAASLDHVIYNMNSVIYQYYQDSYGCVNDSSTSAFVSKYRDASVKNLKKGLNQLKLECVDISEIKYVWRLLRSKICKPESLTNDLNTHGVNDHDEYIGKIFWGYVKNVLTKRRTLLPLFDKERCTEFFRKSFSAINKSKLFCIQVGYPLSPLHRFLLVLILLHINKSQILFVT